MDATQVKIQEAIENSAEWIKVLATKSDNDLERRLGINELLYQQAYKNQHADVCELMELMRRIIIEARIYKDENNIATLPNEMELAIAETEHVIVKTEQRQGVLNETETNFKARKPKVKEEDKDQTSLF